MITLTVINHQSPSLTIILVLERPEKTSDVQLSLLLTVQFDEHGPELIHLATTSYPPSLEVGRMT
jgi:transcription termination factor Rho